LYRTFSILFIGYSPHRHYFEVLYFFLQIGGFRALARAGNPEILMGITASFYIYSVKLFFIPLTNKHE
jgi:hypothetical protein